MGPSDLMERMYQILWQSKRSKHAMLPIDHSCWVLNKSERRPRKEIPCGLLWASEIKIEIIITKENSDY